MTWNPAIPPIRDSGNPLILHSSAAWYDSQLYDLNVLPDALNAETLLGYATGMTAPVQNGTQSIGLFHSTVANFTAWTEHGGTGNGQVLQPTGTATFDKDHVRLSCVVDNVNTSEYWIYYAGWNGSEIKIGLAKAPYSAPQTLTRYGSNPILTVTGNGNNDGDIIQTCSVMPPWISGLSYWVMVYEYRNGVAQNYRVATSADGQTWTKTVSGDVLNAKADGTAFLGPEFHQLRMIGGTCYLLFESGSATVPFALYAASAATPEGPFVPLADGVLQLGPSGLSGSYDETQLATPFLVNIGGIERLFFCGTTTTNPFIGQWSIGVASYNAVLTTVASDTFTGSDGTALTAHAAETGTWIAVDGAFDIQSGKAHTDSDSDNDTIVIDCGAADVIITVTVVPRGDGGGQDSPGLVLRQGDSTHLDFTHFSAASGTFDLYENTGSGAGLKQTQSTTIVDNTSYSLKIVCIGACITAYKDGAEVFIGTANRANSQRTKFGLRLAKAGVTAGRRCSWDNLVIQTLTSVVVPRVPHSPAFGGTSFLNLHCPVGY